MIHRLIRAAAPLLVGLAFALPASAQLPPPPDKVESAPSQPAAPEKPERPTTVPGMVAAFVSTVLVLLIVCKPARKN